MSIRIRPARGSDYATFVRLFPELDVPDPTPERDQWERDFAPSSWIAEDDTGPKGVVYVNVLSETGYVRMIMVDPTARRQGIGRALMKTAEARFREAGCTSWCLNTYPHNTKAIPLYESLGLRKTHDMIVVELPWKTLDGVTPAPDVRTRTPQPADDAHIEKTLGLLAGELAMGRAKGDRPLFVLEGAGGETLGAAVMDPRFPGAKPFKVVRPELAPTLLLALRPHVLPGKDIVLNLPIEAQPELVAALVALGGREKLRVQHMKGALSR
jgi:GNAT superfamily N-acetyltransferase